MLLSLEEIRFDDGDDGRYLEIGGGRYLVYDEANDYYCIWDDPQPMRAKPIAVNAPLRGSIDEIRAFAVDRSHSVDFVAFGILYRFRNGVVLIAGDVVGDVEEGKEVPGVVLAPLVYRYPKEKPPGMSRSLFLARIVEDADIRMRDFMEYFEMPIPKDLDLNTFLNADWGDEDEQLEVHNMEVEAHYTNQQPDTNSWTMAHLNSSLDHSSSGNSHCRGMPRTNIWSMEQLRSSLGNCPHCQGY